MKNLSPMGGGGSLGSPAKVKHRKSCIDLILTPNPHKYGKEYRPLVIKQMGLLEERIWKSSSEEQETHWVDMLLTQQDTIYRRYSSVLLVSHTNR